MLDLSLRGQHQEARRLVEANRPADARERCLRILATFPRHAATYATLGQALLRLGERAAAANVLRRAMAVDPECPEVYAGLGAIHERRGDLPEALWHTERAYELAPGNPAVRDTLRHLRSALQGSGERLELTHGALARIYLRGHLYERAIAVLEELLADDPERHDLRVALAEALWRRGRYAAAEEACQRVLAALPNCLKPSLLLGFLWLDTSRDQEARALLLRAQHLDPDNDLAQALFGSQSPLPPRSSRLPFREGDAPALDLSYLQVDDEAAGRAPAAPQGKGPRLPRMTHGTGPGAGQRPVIVAGQPGTPVGTGTENEGADADETWGDMTLLDVQRQYVAEHPEDLQARLNLARSLREEGYWDEALTQYGQLVVDDPAVLAEVTADLEFLNRLYPRTEALEALLAEARTRGAYRPSAPDL